MHRLCNCAAKEPLRESISVCLDPSVTALACTLLLLLFGPTGQLETQTSLHS